MRIIIDNRSSRPDIVAMGYALEVMKKGRTQSSAKGWVYPRTSFESGVVVEGERNDKSDKIIVSEVV